MCHRIHTAAVSAPVVVVFQTGRLTLFSALLIFWEQKKNEGFFIWQDLITRTTEALSSLSSPPAPLLAPRERKVSSVQKDAPAPEAFSTLQVLQSCVAKTEKMQLCEHQTTLGFSSLYR